MTLSKKLILAPVLGVLLLVNLTVLVYAAIPLAKAYQGNSTRLGLKLIPQPNANFSAADIAKTKAVIESRLSALGARLATVEESRAEGEHLMVLIPPGQDIDRLKNIIIYYGLLELIPLVKESQIPYPTKDAAEKAAKGIAVAGFEVLKYREREESSEGWVIAENRPVLTGADFLQANAVKSEYGNNNYEIAFSLHADGANRFSDWTEKNVGANLAIVLNREVISAPKIHGRISDRGQITGSFTQLSAEALAIALNSGDLPHRVEIVSEQSVTSNEAVQKQSVKMGGLVLTFLALTLGLVYVLTR